MCQHTEAEMPVAWFGPTRCCRQPMPMPLDLLRCSLDGIGQLQLC